MKANNTKKLIGSFFVLGLWLFANPSGKAQTVTGDILSLGLGNYVPTAYSGAVGAYNNVQGGAAFAAGQGNYAGGNYSISLGLNNYVTGYSAVGLGYGNNIQVGYGAALGYGNTIQGATSFGFGYNNTVSGGGGFGLGNSNIVSGLNAFGLGNLNNVSASGGFGIGFGVNAQYFQGTVIGTYNIAPSNVSSASATTWVPSDPIFIVGNGTSDSARSNAMKILKDGTVLINPKGDLSMGAYVNGPTP